MARATARLLPNGDALFKFPYDAVFVARLKERLPRHARAWRPEDRAWWVASAHVNQVCGWFSEFFPGANFVDAGPRRADRAHTPPPPPPRRDDPHATLHLLPSAPPAVVQAAYRALVKTNHPDVLPAPERERAHAVMLAVNAAFEALQARGVA